jgi:hypothetical protein
LRYPQKKGFADRAKEIILKADSNSETNDKDYVFSFYSQLLAKRFDRFIACRNMSAAMSSTASGLNALASTTALIFINGIKTENQTSIT